VYVFQQFFQGSGALKRNANVLVFTINCYHNVLLFILLSSPSISFVGRLLRYNNIMTLFLFLHTLNFVLNKNDRSRYLILKWWVTVGYLFSYICVRDNVKKKIKITEKNICSKCRHNGVTRLSGVYFQKRKRTIWIRIWYIIIIYI